MPALALDDDDVLTEAGVICQHPADQKLKSKLTAPCDTLQCHGDMEAVNFVATEQRNQLRALFNPNFTPE